MFIIPPLKGLKRITLFTEEQISHEVIKALYRKLALGQKIDHDLDEQVQRAGYLAFMEYTPRSVQF